VTKYLQTLGLVFAFALAPAAFGWAQDKPAAPASKPVASPKVVTPLKVQVVIGRYQGEKKLSSMPYTMTLNAGGRSNIRMGTKIPITMLSMSNVPKDAPVGGPIQYQDVGTNIDCLADEGDGGRYLLSISIDDTSVYPDDATARVVGNPSFRSFRSSNTMVLKHGETGQFTSATDKVTGETVKVDVTLTVVK
jgi:hypothetical protein